MSDDIVDRLHIPYVEPCVCVDVVRAECDSCRDRIDAKDEIVRLRADNAYLMRLVGEEGRANRMTMLYESQQAVLDAIDALHQPDYEYPDECTECSFAWPCDTHLLFQPKKINDE